MGISVKYAIRHSFKEEVIIPMVALYHNVDFLFEQENVKLLKTSDGIICKVKKYSIKHICEIENDIKRLYNMDAWSYIKRWYSAMPYMDSMNFLVLELEQI